MHSMLGFSANAENTSVYDKNVDKCTVFLVFSAQAENNRST